MICCDIRKVLTNNYCGFIKFAHCYRGSVLFLKTVAISVKKISFTPGYYSFLTNLYSFFFFFFHTTQTKAYKTIMRVNDESGYHCHYPEFHFILAFCIISYMNISF